jgi:hypothetical protein
MTASKPAAIVPIVEMPRHKAIAWPARERQEMAERLSALGTSINELSDARERLGLERLSSASPRSRAAAHYLLMSSKGQKALADVRAERALLVEALASFHRDTVAEARHMLGLRRQTPSCLRLCELRALFCQARLLEIVAE